MPALSPRASHFKPSATAALLQRVVELRARGIDVLGFHVGEPDFAPPSGVIEATKSALDAGHTRYTPVAGVAALREAIARDATARAGGAAIGASEVLVTSGAKHALYNLCLALLGPGDEAIIPTPCWVSYPQQCELAEATPVLVPTVAESGFRMTPEQLRAALSPRTRALFLCTPANPTGAAYTADELSALAEVARAQDFWIIVDEIYSTLVYDGFRQRSLLEVAPDLRERIIVVDGVSKRFAMTGYRIGWLLGPKAVVAACSALVSQQTSCATSFAQVAALAALEGPDDEVRAMRRAFERRRDLSLSALGAIRGLSCRAPQGAFYLFIDVREQLGRTIAGREVKDDRALCQLLLDEARVALVPGSEFLSPGYVRLSYAAAEAQLVEGLERVARLLA